MWLYNGRNCSHKGILKDWLHGMKFHNFEIKFVSTMHLKASTLYIIITIPNSARISLRMVWTKRRKMKLKNYSNLKRLILIWTGEVQCLRWKCRNVSTIVGQNSVLNLRWSWAYSERRFPSRLKKGKVVLLNKGQNKHWKAHFMKYWRKIQ